MIVRPFVKDDPEAGLIGAVVLADSRHDRRFVRNTYRSMRALGYDRSAARTTIFILLNVGRRSRQR